MPTLLAVAFLVALPVGAVRALTWLLEGSGVADGVPQGTPAHVHVWRRQLRWREQAPDTFEDGYTCGCGRWREPGKV